MLDLRCACDVAALVNARRHLNGLSVVVGWARTGRAQRCLADHTGTAITALAGPSGAGKSTLADIAGGLTGPDEGQILIDGVVLDGGLRRA